MIDITVVNETAPLEAVILGIGTDRGVPRLINPVMKHHHAQGTYPEDEVVQQQLSAFEHILKASGVTVYRPTNLDGIEQIFARDIAFVIEDRLICANMKEAVRQNEIQGIRTILDLIQPSQIVHLPEEVYLEGGDVILWNDFIFVGLGERSNAAGVSFLQDLFPSKEIIGLELCTSDDHLTNILHLDCAFQPIGWDEAIIYEAGFRVIPQALLDLFPGDKLIRVNQDQMNRMFPNIFSISPTRMVIEDGFCCLAKELKNRGYEPISIPYAEIAKLGGLFRCSTLPLRRSGDSNKY